MPRAGCCHGPTQARGRYAHWARSHLHREVLREVSRCRHAALERPPEVRLATLALLQTLLEAPQAGRASTPFCPRLITEALVPNIVWKAGRVASTVRKVAVACLYTLLRGHNPGASDGKGAAVV